MTIAHNSHYEPKKVIKSLVKNKLLTVAQTKTILSSQEKVRQKLEKEKAKQSSGSAGARIDNQITIIDVIAALNLERADGNHMPLDEDAIFQVLADEWGFPYKKIDPLKLDLNVVTTTIPRNFAMKHLVLPIEIKDGSLTVATPNPFNMEVMEDITRVSNMRVNPVVSSIGWVLPALIAGETIVAIVLNLPTTGPVLWNALLQQDMFLAAGFLMLLSLLTIIGSLVSDILLAWLDPRIRYDDV